MRSVIEFVNTHFFQLFVFLTIIYSVAFFIIRRKLLRTSHALSKRNIEIKTQRDELEKLNQQLFASSLKIDQQNFDLKRQYKEIKKQKDNVIKKTVDLLVVNREQRENLKLREGLTNMIVHDLKNPISNILNLSENKEISYFANDILTMVENILDVQKYEGVMMSLKKSSFSLNKVIIDAEKQVSLFAERKNIKIINKIKNKISVFADEDIIKRVIVNFLSNSIKYSYANGDIVLDAEMKNKDRIKINIIDAGIGIKKDKIHLIFDKFSQVMAKKTGSARSSGLGLAFCKIAVQSHGGEINVESNPEKFTVFSFDIELSDKKSKESNIIDKDIDIIKLNDKDKKYLMNFYKELYELEVYEIGKLRDILIKIDETFSSNLLQWKNKLNKSIYNCNFDLYKELINKII